MPRAPTSLQAASHLASIANGRLDMVRQLLAKASGSAAADGADGAGAAAAVRYYLVAKAAMLEAAATAHGRAAEFYTAAGRQSEAVDDVLAAKQREVSGAGRERVRARVAAMQAGGSRAGMGKDRGARCELQCCSAAGSAGMLASRQSMQRAGARECKRSA